jgi:hypothetical protein
MRRKTIDNILYNEENLNLFKAAKAILEDEKKKAKRNHIPNSRKSFDAWAKHKARLQTEEAFRQQLAKAWKKSHTLS